MKRIAGILLLMAVTQVPLTFVLVKTVYWSLLLRTKAYSYPKSGSSVVYTFPQPTSSTRYTINSIVFCCNCYWAKYNN